MNRFLSFFLVSFILHLAVGAVLLSRTGILGGKGSEETELSDVENSDFLEETAENSEPTPDTFSKKTPVEVKTKKKSSPVKIKKITKKKKPIKPKSVKKPIVKKSKEPPVEQKQKKLDVEKVTKEIPAEAAKSQKPQEPQASDKALTPPENPMKEKAPELTEPLDSEKALPLEETQKQPDSSDTKEEWVDEDEKIPTEDKEKKEESPPTQEVPSSDPVKDSADEEKKPEPVEGEPSNSSKKTIPDLESSSARSHEQLKQLEGNPMPVYPKEALEKRWEGRAEVFYYVNSGGFVEKIQLKNSSGHSTLDNSALRALSRYRYYPGQEGWVRHPVEFFLEKDKEIVETAPLGERDPAKQNPVKKNHEQ